VIALKQRTGGKNQPYSTIISVKGGNVRKRLSVKNRIYVRFIGCVVGILSS